MKIKLMSGILAVSMIFSAPVLNLSEYSIAAEAEETLTDSAPESEEENETDSLKQQVSDLEGEIEDLNRTVAALNEEISRLKALLDEAGISYDDASSEDETAEPTAAELDELLKEQPCYVLSTEYVIQDVTSKTLYPDMLNAVIYNNSQASIKNAEVAFAAWDVNNQPVKIVSQNDFSGGSYIAEYDFEDINMLPGATFGENDGMTLRYDDQLPIGKFKAIVVNYTDSDGNTWENPYYDTWCDLYEGKVLEVPAPEVGSTGIATTDLNLRSGADGNASIIGVVPNQAAVTVTGDIVDGWIPVSYNGVDGYVFAELLAVGFD